MSPGLVRFTLILAFVGVHAVFSRGVGRFGGAARWTAIGETGFIRLQFELFRANSANFQRKRHADSMITTNKPG